MLEFKAAVKTETNGKQNEFELFDFSRESLSVEHQDGVDLAAQLQRPHILINGHDYGRVNLSFQGEYTTIDNKTIARFKASDREGKALLWQLMYKYKLNSETAEEDTSKENHPDKLKMPPGRGVYTEKARQLRVDFMREHGGSDLENISQTSIDARNLTGNLESFIGAVQVPVGVAGPLRIDGTHVQDTVYAPIATTEGALVASITRGAYAISLGSGAKTRAFGQRMVRTPSFTLKDMSQAHFFGCWVRAHLEEMKQVVQRYSNYVELVRLETDVFGRAVYVNFVYRTGDASGQNMTTTCTWEACKYILREIEVFPDIEVEKFLVESGPSSDKKVSAMSLIKGRGIQVQAEVTIPAKVVRRVLKTTPLELKNSMLRLSESFSRSGGVGCSINVANVIAGIFTATGQDIASVHESSIANSSVDVTEDGDLYWCLSLPSLVVGTVGGGTGLSHQRECLEMLDCYGGDKVMRFAEIIAGFCLALDISTGSAIVSGDFATAHESLGRNRDVAPIKLGDLNEKFFQTRLRETEQDKLLIVSDAFLDEDFELEGSIVTELTSRKIKRTVGLFPYEVEYNTQGEQKQAEVMVKIKPAAEEVAAAARQLAALCNAELEKEVGANTHLLGLDKCDIRELAIYKQTDPRFVKHTPKFYGAVEDSSQDNYVLLLERLRDMDLMDTADDVSGWTPAYIKAALAGLAECHSIWYAKESRLLECDWLGAVPSAYTRVQQKKLYQLLGNHAHEEFPELYTSRHQTLLHNTLEGMAGWWAEIDAMPKTLIHNDFNPRNIAFRKKPDGPELCVYDWELATMHIPQFDIAELLIYVLPSNFDLFEVQQYVEFYRQTLSELTGSEVNSGIFERGYELAVRDFYISKITAYLMTHTFREYDFMDRVVASATRMLKLIENGPGETVGFKNAGSKQTNKVG